MPGTIATAPVHIGQKLNKGEVLLRLAMMMETTVRRPASGMAESKISSCNPASKPASRHKEFVGRVGLDMNAHSRQPVTWRDAIRQARHRYARARRRFVLLRGILSPVQAFRSALAGETARTSAGKFPVGEAEGAASMRALRTARGGHHVPGAESANRQCGIPLSRGASGVIH